MKVNFKLRTGQALITLLAFTASAMIITAGAVAVTIINSQGTGKFAQGEEALQIAEAGADNAILRLLRNSSYLGETLTVGNGAATITVTGTTTKTIVSEGVTGNFRRKIQVDGTYTNNILTISNWREID